MRTYQFLSFFFLLSFTLSKKRRVFFLLIIVNPQTIPSPLPSPQSLLQKNQQLAQQAQAQANRKSSLNAVIDKLKSEMDSNMTPPVINKTKGEYQIKSSGTTSDGIKITFNKTKKSDSKSPKHTGYLLSYFYFSQLL